MPIYQGNQEIGTQYVDSYQLAKAYLGSNLVLGNETFISASGGTITTSGNYKIHTFTTVGTSSFNILATGSINANNTIEYLIVAGGGAGGISTNGQGLGGGAGGMLTGSYFITSASLNSVIVGAGGIGSNATNNNPTSGSISSLFGLTAFGGGTQNVASGNGGSGAGLGTGTVGQGNNGGTLNIPGGGGAGQVGGDGTDSCPGFKLPGLVSGNGGSGSLSSISGTPTYYAGGGAGGGLAGDFCDRAPGVGGIGGGGNGGNYTGNAAARSGQAGTANTGGGGGGIGEYRGGSNPTDTYSGNGGSGIVIVRYLYQ